MLQGEPTPPPHHTHAHTPSETSPFEFHRNFAKPNLATQSFLLGMTLAPVRNFLEPGPSGSEDSKLLCLQSRDKTNSQWQLWATPAGLWLQWCGPLPDTDPPTSQSLSLSLLCIAIAVPEYTVGESSSQIYIAKHF